MSNKIKVIIADDNIHICEFIREYLSQREEIEILGIANTDEDEIKLIEDLKPEIVITDLMRNHKYTGLDIIKQYATPDNSPYFLVISAEKKEEIIQEDVEVAGYIQKNGLLDYELIYNELKKIKADIEEKEKNKIQQWRVEFNKSTGEKWQDIYRNDRIIDIGKYLDDEDIKLLNKLQMPIENKIYTASEYCALKWNLLLYCEDEEATDEIKKIQKDLNDVGVSDEEYNAILDKFIEIGNWYGIF